MTQRNKLIVGAVVVLGVLFLLDRNRKMKEVARLKALADEEAEAKSIQTNTKSIKSVLDTKPVNLRADALSVRTTEMM
jgi:hypothetical protein